jgi:hypothetical protein
MWLLRFIGGAGPHLRDQTDVSGDRSHCCAVPHDDCENGLMFQLEHSEKHKIDRRKLLIPCRRFERSLENQRVRLWKKCLLSRTFRAYLSRLDRLCAYFIWYVVFMTFTVLELVPFRTASSPCEVS